MAVKNCILGNIRVLDKDDKKFVHRLHKQGRDEGYIVGELNKKIGRDLETLARLFEDQGIAVNRASSSVEDILSSEDEKAEGLRGTEDKISDTEEVAESDTSEEVPPTKEKTGPSKTGQSRLGGASEQTSSTKQYNIAGTQEEMTGGRRRVRQKMPRWDVESKSSPDRTAATDKVMLEYAQEVSPVLASFIKSGGKVVLGAEKSRYVPETDTIEVEKGATDIVTMLEHEAIHAATVAFLLKGAVGFQVKIIDSFANARWKNITDSVRKDIQYLEKAISVVTGLDVSKMDERTVQAIAYIRAQTTDQYAVAEFLAIMKSDEKVAADIFAALGKKQGLDKSTIKAAIDRLLGYVRAWFNEVTKEDLEKDLDIDLLNDVMQRTLEQGVGFREQQYEEFRKWSSIQSPYDYGPASNAQIYATKFSMDYLNFAVNSMITSKIEAKSIGITKRLHTTMYDNFPIYMDVADKIRGVYDNGSALAQFIHTITGEDIDKMKKANVLAKFADVNAHRTEVINDQIRKLNKLSKGLSTRDKDDLDILVTKTPLHDYFALAGTLTDVESIENELTTVRKALWKINTRAVRDIEQLVEWNIHERDTGNIYNIETKYPAILRDTEFSINLRKLNALTSIKEFGTERFVELLQHKELMDVIKDNSVANRLATLNNEGSSNVRDSLVMDYYKENIEIRAVEPHNMYRYQYGERTGWKILEEGGKGELGIVYREIVDSTELQGAYTDIKLTQTDVTVDSSLEKYPKVVKTPTGSRLRLTRDQKIKMGLNTDFAQSLVRSAAHAIAIQESQIIRDSLLKKETYRTLNSARDMSKLVETIETPNEDNPWFLKMGEGVKYSELDAKIRAKYMPVGDRASNVKAFNEQVDLVRKDISHWLLGDSAKSLFENPQYKWALRILKNLVSGAKIRMVVLNPLKIANDNISNLLYLGVMGVDPLFIREQYQDISTAFAEYRTLTAEIFQLKTRLVSRPNSEDTKKRLRLLQKRLKRNSIGDIGDKGFVNSLGSDLVSKSADTSSGFQADMHTALEYLLTNKKGNKNYVSHFIMQLQKVGFQAEDFYGYLGGVVGNFGTTKVWQQELDQVAERLREIKSEEDVVNYVAQFTTSPASEAVRMGATMTDLSDVLAKETLYRYLTQIKGMSPADARIETLDSFPDYKENLPLWVKQLSDKGIIMFPSFWLRINKIIFRAMQKKPLNVGIETATQEMLGSNLNTIFGSNVISKATSYGGIIHYPFEPVGVGSIVPTSIFGS